MRVLQYLAGLPGCWSQGATETEALANIRDAIREYLEAVTELTRARMFARSKSPANG
jgi:predicted RNase H-like HicB family nuclease